MSIWRLPCDHTALHQLTLSEATAAIWVRRMFIRNHRDQLGDDRCWLDDWLVWQLLDDTPTMPHFSGEEGMTECRLFYGYRRSDDVDTLPFGAILDPNRWDDDLCAKSARQLGDELWKLQLAIRAHRDFDNPRTATDDRVLYMVLPEKLPADFRLPLESEFLGEDKAPHAGCPAFWRSHLDCDPSHCNQHRWGPCP